MDLQRISKIVETEIESISHGNVVETIRGHLVPLRVENREWDYGDEGQTYPCWIVLEDKKTDSVIAYCEQGFGPSEPWGLMSLARFPNMGMDSGWFAQLEDAVRESMFWFGDDPPNYEVR